MKFVDILGEAGLSDEYRKVSRKVKLIYKTLRTGGVKIGKLIPDMVPFFTGFEMVDDKDALITYELPTTYYLESGNAISPYKIIITGITINCEKYPALADDIDIKGDILGRLSHRLDNALSTSFGEGEQIKFQIRKNNNLPSSGFENVLDESIVNDPIEQERQIEKAKTVYKAFRKGTLKFKINDNLDGEHVIIAKYELPKMYKLKTSFLEEYMRNIGIIVNWKDIKCEIIEGPKNTRKPIIDYVLQMIRQKIERFEYNIVLHFDNQKPNDVKGGQIITLKEENEHETLVKKAPTVFKALKKGKVSMDVDFLSDWRSQTQKKYTFNYDLGNVYIIETDPFENNYNVKVLIPTIKINCEENPDLNNNQRIKLDILDLIKKKFNNFGLNIILRATKFHLKHNGTWVKL
jgi:hypothetical protein